MSLIRMSGRSLRNRDSASPADPTPATTAPWASSRRVRNSRVSGSSSTTSTCRSSSEAVSRNSAAGSTGSGARRPLITSVGSSTVKVAPFPSPALCTRTVPPCIPTRSLTIDSPSPSPPNRRVIDRSAWWNRSKTCGRNSPRMPAPSSATPISACVRVARRVTSTWPPRGVNLTAFDSRFHTTCCRRAGIAGDRPHVGVDLLAQLDALVVGLVEHGLDRIVDDRPQIDGLEVEAQLAGDDAADVEQVGNELRLHARVAGDDVEAAGQHVRVAGAAHHQVSPAEDGVERRPQFVRDHRDELVLHPVGPLGFGPRHTLGFEQAFALGGSGGQGDALLLRNGGDALLFGDVARDFRHADDAARGVEDRRDGERNVDQPAVLAAAHGFEVIDALAAADAGEDVVFLGLTIGRDQDADRLADQLRGGVAEQPLGPRVARLDDAVEILGNDRVVRRFDNGRQVRRHCLGGFAEASAFVHCHNPT